MKRKINDSSAFQRGTILGISVGAVVFILGFALCILGLTDSIEILIEAKNLKAKLINGTPGIVFALLGFLIIWRYKPKESIRTTEVIKKTPSGYTYSHRESESDRAMMSSGR